MEQIGLFDFLEEQEVEKPKEIYYIAKEDLETQFIDGYTLGYHYEWTVQKPNYKGENFIGLLPNNRVYKNGFIYQFKTEKEAKQMIVDTYQKWKDSFDRMKADKESYPVVEYDNEPRVRGNLYLLTEPVKQLDGSKMLFSEHWYSGLNGYFYTLTLPYEVDRAFIKSAELQLPINLINALSTSYDKQCLTKSQVEQDLSKSKSYGSETQLDEVKEDVEEYEMDIAEDRW